MTARENIRQAIGHDAPGAQFWIEEQLDAFRAEVLREAAAKIRAIDDWSAHQAADLIDPDKEQP